MVHKNVMVVLVSVVPGEGGAAPALASVATPYACTFEVGTEFVLPACCPPYEKSWRVRIIGWEAKHRMSKSLSLLEGFMVARDSAR